MRKVAAQIFMTFLLLVLGLLPNYMEAKPFAHPQDSTHLIAIVLLDDAEGNFLDDIAVTVILPSGDEFPIKTHRGFFSLQIQENIAPTDSIELRVPAQVFDGAIAMVEFVPFTLKITVREAANLEIHPPYVALYKTSAVLDASDEPAAFNRGKELTPNIAFALPITSKKYLGRQERIERRMVRKNIPIQMQ